MISLALAIVIQITPVTVANKSYGLASGIQHVLKSDQIIRLHTVPLLQR